MNDRYVEVNWDGEAWAVILHRTTESNVAEQEFATLGSPDMLRYIEEWCRNGKIVF